MNDYRGPRTAEIQSRGRNSNAGGGLTRAIGRGVEHRDKLAILGFDPGGTTGWSLLVLPERIESKDLFSYRLDTILAHKASWQHGEIATEGHEMDAIYQMFKLCRNFPNAVVVAEDFILRAERREKSRNLLSPVRITAGLEQLLWLDGRKVHKQSAGQTKPIVTDEYLKHLRCLARDLPDHARDADRHVLMFLRRCLGPQGVPLKRVAWPWVYIEQALLEEDENEHQSA